MPKTPTKRSHSDSPPASPDESKPYDKPTKDKAKSSNPKTSPSKARKWSRNDRIAITLAVVEKGIKAVDWDEMAKMFEGRTRAQTYDQWRWVWSLDVTMMARVDGHWVVMSRKHIRPSLESTGNVGGE
jgi:hypothetical protein